MDRTFYRVSRLYAMHRGEAQTGMVRSFSSFICSDPQRTWSPPLYPQADDYAVHLLGEIEHVSRWRSLTMPVAYEPGTGIGLVASHA